MSGHSKWSNIQHKKGKTDLTRASVFTKLGKAITIAAQHGGGDPDINFSLRLAIEKAKSANMPKDNIERAISKGTGDGKDGEALQEVLYEGFGSGGVAMLVQAVTDNLNRTVSEVKYVFGKNNGTMGNSGSVKWQFDQKGVFLVSTEELANKNIDKDDFSLHLMDAGVDDIRESIEGLEILGPRESFQKISEVVAESDIILEDSGLQWVAKETAEVDNEACAQVEKLIEALEELDDVDVVYTNLYDQ
ncbi:MAG: YebC/PmpR family DNA-binding transcriptional regulator [Candidatus Magasanikbacteria bacterium CG_4_10_14_0_2_um_filter_37_12]|uniref:Probable transcriptional regulatory protein COX81_02250 n=1 Tax=Candidatus Magasanikbacteria bacterium CG_4_10_14_0_2_um_filter_37_12 TaxID=1974637 RepID=A0A2M7V836_9BACT|nr:MAG: YebC/PmpR family DNA-binding transcriptional regulator [Candidatus Magasanikbacteria bacterium CG_4_10_14_0_2_um_filter_37_12]